MCTHARTHTHTRKFREKLKVEHTVDEIQGYQQNWLQHVKRTEHSRIPRKALEYKSKGKSDIGRPKARRSNQQHIQDWVFTGQDPGVLHLFAFMAVMMMMMIYIHFFIRKVSKNSTLQARLRLQHNVSNNQTCITLYQSTRWKKYSRSKSCELPVARLWVLKTPIRWVIPLSL
jgi:hypothetical protein